MTVSESLLKITELTKQNLQILNMINDAFYTKSNHLSTVVGDTAYVIPSYIALENKVNHLQDAFNNLVHASKSGQAWFNFDGNSREISVAGYQQAPSPINLTPQSKFRVEVKNLFKDMLNPSPYLNFDISNLPDNIQQVYVKKIIPYSDDVITGLGMNDSMTTEVKSWKKVYDVLNPEEGNVPVAGTDYLEYDTVYDLPIRHCTTKGTYVIEEVLTDEITVNLTNKLKFKIHDTTPLKVIGFDGASSRDMDLTTDHELITFDGSAKMKIESIDIDAGIIDVEVLSGEYVNPQGCGNIEIDEGENILDKVSDYSILKLYTTPEHKRQLHIPLEEDKYIYITVAPINSTLGIQSAWGDGLVVCTSNLKFDRRGSVDDGGIPDSSDGGFPEGETGFKDFYDGNVDNIGDLMAEIAQTMYPSITKYSPTEQDILLGDPGEIIGGEAPNNTVAVVQINKHLNDSDTVKNIRALYSQKKQYQADLNEIQARIASLTESLAQISFDDMSGTRSAYTAQIADLKDQQNNLTTSISKIVDSIALAANNSEIPIEGAKFRIRGYVDVDAYVDNIKSGFREGEAPANDIIGVEVRYRYRNAESPQANVAVINDFLFTEWSTYCPPLRERRMSYQDGIYKISAVEVADGENAPKYNQVDIPITQGEVVEMQARIIWGYGYPFVKMTSEWSTPYIQEFPAELMQDVQVTTIIEENNSDIEAMRFENILANKGVIKHIDDALDDQDVRYFHKPESISSGFYTNERRVIPLKDKLLSMDSNIIELMDMIQGTTSEALRVVCTVDGVSTEIAPDIDNAIQLPAYSSIQDSSEKIPTGSAFRMGGVVYAPVTVTITNVTNHAVHLFPMFPGSRDTYIKDATYKVFNVAGFFGKELAVDPTFRFEDDQETRTPNRAQPLNQKAASPVIAYEEEEEEEYEEPEDEPTAIADSGEDEVVPLIDMIEGGAINVKKNIGVGETTEAELTKWESNTNNVVWYNTNATNNKLQSPIGLSGNDNYKQNVTGLTPGSAKLRCEWNHDTASGYLSDRYAETTVTSWGIHVTNLNNFEIVDDIQCESGSKFVLNAALTNGLNNPEPPNVTTWSVSIEGGGISVSKWISERNNIPMCSIEFDTNKIEQGNKITITATGFNGINFTAKKTINVDVNADKSIKGGIIFVDAGQTREISLAEYEVDYLSGAKIDALVGYPFIKKTNSETQGILIDCSLDSVKKILKIKGANTDDDWWKSMPEIEEYETNISVIKCNKFISNVAIYMVKIEVAGGYLLHYDVCVYKIDTQKITDLTGISMNQVYDEHDWGAASDKTVMDLFETNGNQDVPDQWDPICQSVDPNIAIATYGSQNRLEVHGIGVGTTRIYVGCNVRGNTPINPIEDFDNLWKKAYYNDLSLYYMGSFSVTVGEQEPLKFSYNGEEINSENPIYIKLGENATINLADILGTNNATIVPTYEEEEEDEINVDPVEDSEGDPDIMPLADIEFSLGVNNHIGVRQQEGVTIDYNHINNIQLQNFSWKHNGNTDFVDNMVFGFPSDWPRVQSQGTQIHGIRPGNANLSCSFSYVGQVSGGPVEPYKTIYVYGIVAESPIGLKKEEDWIRGSVECTVGDTFDINSYCVGNIYEEAKHESVYWRTGITMGDEEIIKIVSSDGDIKMTEYNVKFEALKKGTAKFYINAYDSDSGKSMNTTYEIDVTVNEPLKFFYPNGNMEVNAVNGVRIQLGETVQVNNVNTGNSIMPLQNGTLEPIEPGGQPNWDDNRQIINLPSHLGVGQIAQVSLSPDSGATNIRWLYSNGDLDNDDPVIDISSDVNAATKNIVGVRPGSTMLICKYDVSDKEYQTSATTTVHGLELYDSTKLNGSGEIDIIIGESFWLTLNVVNKEIENTTWSWSHTGSSDSFYKGDATAHDDQGHFVFQARQKGRYVFTFTITAEPEPGYTFTTSYSITVNVNEKQPLKFIDQTNNEINAIVGANIAMNSTDNQIRLRVSNLDGDSIKKYGKQGEDGQDTEVIDVAIDNPTGDGSWVKVTGKMPGTAYVTAESNLGRTTSNTTRAKIIVEEPVDTSPIILTYNGKVVDDTNGVRVIPGFIDIEATGLADDETILGTGGEWSRETISAPSGYTTIFDTWQPMGKKVTTRVIGPGSGYIKAKSTKGREGRALIIVDSNFAFEPGALKMKPGESKKIDITSGYAERWESDNSSVARVNNNSSTGCEVIAGNIGKANIKAIHPTGYEGIVPVTVSEAPSVEIEPHKVLLSEARGVVRALLKNYPDPNKWIVKWSFWDAKDPNKPCASLNPNATDGAEHPVAELTYVADGYGQLMCELEPTEENDMEIEENPHDIIDVICDNALDALDGIAVDPTWIQLGVGYDQDIVITKAPENILNKLEWDIVGQTNGTSKDNYISIQPGEKICKVRGLKVHPEGDHDLVRIRYKNSLDLDVISVVTIPVVVVPKERVGKVDVDDSGPAIIWTADDTTKLNDVNIIRSYAYPQRMNQIVTFRSRNPYNNGPLGPSILQCYTNDLKNYGNDQSAEFKGKNAIIPNTNKEYENPSYGQALGYTVKTGAEGLYGLTGARNTDGTLMNVSGYGLNAYVTSPSKYGLCMESDAVNSKLTLAPGESISFTVHTEYRLSPSMDQIVGLMNNAAWTIGFNVRNSLYKDPLYYQVKFVAKYQQSAADKMAAAKADVDNLTKYNVTVR